MGVLLTAEPGCGRCADLLAACLLGADERARFEAHLTDHVGAPSLWDEINKLASQEDRKKWQTRSAAISRENVLLESTV